MIAPDVVKGGFVVALRHGDGVLLMRDKDAGWSNPVFVSMTGGSFGFQVGVQATDLFLVVRNRRSLDRILRNNGKLTLGAGRFDRGWTTWPPGFSGDRRSDAP